MLTLETDRLRLRMWTLEDFEAFAAMSAEPEVTRFTTADGKPLSRSDAWRSLCVQVGHWHLRGFGMFRRRGTIEWRSRGSYWTLAARGLAGI